MAVAVSREFADLASSEMLQFLRDYELDQPVVSDMLAHMRDTGAPASEAAVHFLETRPDIWTAWLSDDVADRVRAAFNRGREALLAPVAGVAKSAQVEG